MLNLGVYLANRQQYADARTVLTALAAGAGDEGVKTRALQLLTSITEVERRAAAGDLLMEHERQRSAPGPVRLPHRQRRGGSVEGRSPGHRVSARADRAGRGDRMGRRLACTRRRLTASSSSPTASRRAERSRAARVRRRTASGSRIGRDPRGPASARSSRWSSCRHRRRRGDRASLDACSRRLVS